MVYKNFLHLNLVALKTSLVVAGFKISKIFSTWVGKIFATFFIILLAGAFISPAAIINLVPSVFVRGDSIIKEIFSTFFVFAVTDEGAELFSLWLGGLLGVVLIAPIISNTLTSSYSKSLLLGVRRNISYQISDSIMLQFLSPLIIITLIYTLTVSFLYRYSYGDNATTTLLMLYVWLVSVFMMTMMGWFNELMVRKTGIKYKFFYAIIVGFFFFLIYGTETGEGFFGLSFWVANTLPFIVNSIFTTVVAFILITIIATAVLYTIFVLGSTALHKYPEVFKKKEHPIRLGSSLSMSAMKVLFRYETIKAPLIFMILVLTPVFIFQTSSTTVTVYSLAFILPLIFNLTIFINIFGLLNSGNAWLASLPKFRQNILPQAFLFKIVLVSAAAVTVSLPGFILGNISAEIWLKFLVLNLASSSICFIIALRNSVFKPSRYDFHVRGENIAPPGASLKLTGQMILFGGVPLLVVAPIIPLWGATLIMLFGMLLASIMVSRLSKKLDTTHMNHIISKMGQ